MKEELEQRAHERDETHLERADRNLTELLQELRVVATGVQVILGFLLIVPFSAGFVHVDGPEHYLYVAVLLLTAASAGLLIAPTSLHRLIFRQGDKAYLVARANAFALAGIACLALAMTGILAFVTGHLFGWTTGAVIGSLAALFFGGLWFGIGLRRRGYVRGHLRRDLPGVRRARAQG